MQTALCLLLICAASSQAQVINLYAGGAIYDGPALSGRLAFPGGACSDSAGNVYIADTYNHRIRKISVGTNVISTIAGDGFTRFAGDGGPALNASLFRPAAITIDKRGNLYFSDQGNFRIRRIDVLTGIITSIGGNGWQGDGDNVGSALNTPLGFISGICVDTSENFVLFCDQGNHKVRKINLTTSIMTKVAGSFMALYNGDNIQATNAFLSSPSGVCVDKDNNIYISDNGNRRIRKINALTNIITSVAGNAVNGTLFENVPATSARLNGPSAVVVDNQYNIYITEETLCSIKKVNGQTGIINTIAGAGYPGFAGDDGPAIAAVFNHPMGLFVDKTGNILITDRFNDRIRLIDSASTVVNTIAGTQVLPYGDGGPATGAVIDRPSAIAFDRFGNSYVGDKSSARIRKIDASTGVISTIAGTGVYSITGNGGPALSATLKEASSICLDSTGNLYFIDDGVAIRKIDIGTGIIHTVATTYFAQSLCATKAGDILFIDQERIKRITASTGVITTIAGTGASGLGGIDGPALAASFYQASGICLDSAENIYVCQEYGRSIRRVDAISGIVTAYAGIEGSAGFSGDDGPATSAELRDPIKIAMDRADNLFILDSYGSYRIRRVDARTKIITTYAGTGVEGRTGDGGLAAEASITGGNIAVDPFNNLYLCDYLQRIIRKISAPIAVHKYIFSGDGDWDTAANWENNIVPPSDLDENTEIVINPAGEGECVLSRVQHTKASTIITVQEGKKFRIVGGLFIQR